MNLLFLILPSLEFTFSVCCERAEASVLWGSSAPLARLTCRGSGAELEESSPRVLTGLVVQVSRVERAARRAVLSHALLLTRGRVGPGGVPATSVCVLLLLRR